MDNRRYPFGEKPSPWDQDDAPPSWLLWGPLVGLVFWALLIGAAIWAVM